MISTNPYHGPMDDRELGVQYNRAFEDGGDVVPHPQRAAGVPSQLPPPLLWAIPGLPLPQLADLRESLVKQMVGAVALGGAPGDVAGPALDAWLAAAIAALLAMGGVA